MDLSLILIFVLAAVGMLAFTQWKKISKLEQGLRSETRALEEKRDDAEKARKESRERTHELDETKKQLQEARNKLKKRERDETEPREKPKKGKSERDEAAAAPSPVIVRITDQELAAEHQRTKEKLEEEIEALRSELAAGKKRDDARAREAERASKMLSDAASASSAPAPAPAVVAAPVAASAPLGASAGSASEEATALRAQLDAMKKVAVDRERELKREIRRSQDDAKHALRRAANNQALYAVLHGQLELAEDRLAAYKLKYEGAKSIEELRRESKKDRAKKQRDARDARDQPRGQNGEPPTLETTASELLAETTGDIPPPSSEPPAPSTIEVSKEDIVSTRPTDSIPPEEVKHDA